MVYSKLFRYETLPRIPEIKGIETFTGEYLPVYCQNSSIYKGKVVCVYGPFSALSAKDVSLEICKAAKKVS